MLSDALFCFCIALAFYISLISPPFLDFWLHCLETEKPFSALQLSMNAGLDWLMKLTSGT